MVLVTTGIEFSKPWVAMLVSRYETVTRCTNETAPLNFTQDHNTPAVGLTQPMYAIFNPLSTVDITAIGSFNHTTSNSTQVCHTTTKLINPGVLFYAVAANGLISSFLCAGMMSYTEAAIIKTVFTRKKTYSYGEQKVFGPIGSAVGALMAGVAVDHFHPKHVSKYVITFFIYVPLSLLMLPFFI